MIPTRELLPLTPPLNLQRFSRFKRQLVFRNVDGRTFFGTFRVPRFTVSPTDTFHLVVEGEENRLDLVAYRYYHSPELWWIIAVVNDILSPFDSAQVGDILRIPSMDAVIPYLSL